MAKLIGTGPNQVPTNADLGTMAYQDYDVVGPYLKGGRRNLALNGNFTVSQRGNYSTATSFDSNDYFVDRWRADRSTVSGTVQRIAGGFDRGLNSIKAAATSSATGNIGFAQRWNQTELPQLYSDNQGDYVVFSGWLRSNSSKANWYIYHLGMIDPQPHSGSGEWEYMVSKVPTASLSSNIDFNAFLYDGSNVAITSGDYVEIALVQIEVNNTGVATPFEHRSYGEDLSACQRYFERRGTDIGGWEFISDAGQLTSVNTYQCAVRFNEQMRVAPTMSITGTVSNLKLIRAAALVDVTGVSAADNTNGRTLLLYGTCASSGGAAGEQIRIQTVTPGTWVNFDAEL